MLVRSGSVSWPLILLLTIFLASGARAQETAKIEWRLENTFRYFKNPEDTARHRRVFEALSAEELQKPIQNIERRLATETGGRGWSEDIYKASSGFADRLAQEQCWYQPSACSDYVKPRSHKVLVKAAGVAAPCTWRVGTTTAVQSASCEKEVALSIPYPAGSEVSVTIDGRTIAPLPIKVRDVLVVSLGDSFASGEGNPDKPVRFDPSKTLDYGRDNDLKGFPVRSGIKLDRRIPVSTTANPQFQNGRAGWVHRGCHRSLYSQHLRVALQLALDDKDQHQAVTYVGLSCTGGEIIEGLFEAWKGSEISSPAELTRISQLSGASNAICGTEATKFATYDFSQGGAIPALKSVSLRTCKQATAREIDLVLLSVGGNDIGFSSLVANAAISVSVMVEALADMFGADIKITVPEAEARAQSLHAKYAAVADALKAVLHLKDASRVVFGAYPVMATTETGAACKPGNAGMDVTPFFTIQAEKAAAIETFMENTMTPLMRKAASDNGWRFAEAQRSWFQTHGICAIADSERGQAALADLNFPRRFEPAAVAAKTFARAETVRSSAAPVQSRRGVIGPAPHKEKWQNFKPDEFLPYASRQRWFRTPNDAFLTAHYHDNKFDTNELISLTRFSAYSGAFHPTAEGNAAAADALLAIAREALGRTPVPN